jgi:hypothetical protein
LHFTTIFYSELAWSDARRDEALSDGRGGGRAAAGKWQERPEYLEAIANSGDPDSIYGSNTTVDAESLVRTYEHERKWGKALALYDDAVASRDVSTRGAPAAAASSGSYEVGVCRTLFSAGLEGLRALYTSNLDTTSFAGSTSALEIGELQFEAAWRQSMWEPLSAHRTEHTLAGNGSNARLWRLLQRMEDQDVASCDGLLASSQLAIWSELQSVEAENASRLNPMLAEAQMLREISESVEIVKAAAAAANGSDSNVVAAVDRMRDLWMLRLESGRVFFDSRGAILSCRAAVLGVLARQFDPTLRKKLHERVSQLRVACLRELGNHARQSGHDHNCTAAVRGLQSMGSAKPWIEYFHLERAKNLCVASTRLNCDALCCILWTRALLQAICRTFGSHP